MLVSVIICTHRRPQLLPRAIRSVLGQSYADLELIIVDDASGDDTCSVVREFDDPRIRYLPNSVNLGLPASRNVGIAVAKGEFIAFLDDDDEWLSEKLRLQVPALSARPAKVGACWCYQIWQTGSTERIRSIPLQGNVHSRLMMHDVVMTQPLLVRKSALNAIGGFDPQFSYFEDYDMSLRLSERFEFVTVEEPLVRMHSTPGSMSKDQQKRLAAMQALIDKHPRLRKGRVGGRWNFRIAREQAGLGDTVAARRSVSKAIRCAPWDPVLIVRYAVVRSYGFGLDAAITRRLSKVRCRGGVADGLRRAFGTKRGR